MTVMPFPTTELSVDDAYLIRADAIAFIEGHRDEVARVLASLQGPGVDSTNRLPLLLDAMETVDPFGFAEVFVWVFAAEWSGCDDTWHLRTSLLEMLEHVPEMGVDWRTALTAADQAWFAALPPRLKVWRGCSAERVHGLSWSVSREVATIFAKGHRGIAVPDPVIVSAMIRKDDVLFACNDRGEEEVLFNPMWSAKRLIVEPWHGRDLAVRPAGGSRR